MASKLVSKLRCPPAFTVLVSCQTRSTVWFLSGLPKVHRLLSSAQTTLRPRSGYLCQGRAAAVMAGARHSSSDSDPPEKISRYPVPYRKDLPYDIVELMEEVESKVKRFVFGPFSPAVQWRCHDKLNFSLQGGFLPNVFKVLSHRPAEFRAFFAYYNELMNKETGEWISLLS